MARLLLVFSWAILSLAVANGAWGQSKPGSARPATQSDAQKAAPAGNAERNDQEVAAMKGDLQKMRVLLNQMQMNLAFVQNTTTPLKHQFELEIDMWQILLQRMERRVASMSGNTTSADSPGAKPEP
jgi:hypothetical protein